MIFRYILWALLAYFLYKFIFDFIIPLFRATRHIKKQVNEFQNRMQQQQQEPAQQNTFTKQTTTPSKAGDYIEFEEVKRE